MPLYFIAKLFHLFEGQILLKNRHAETCRFLEGVDTLDAASSAGTLPGQKEKSPNAN